MAEHTQADTEVRPSSPTAKGVRSGLPEAEDAQCEGGAPVSVARQNPKPDQMVGSRVPRCWSYENVAARWDVPVPFLRRLVRKGELEVVVGETVFKTKYRKARKGDV